MYHIYIYVYVYISYHPARRWRDVAACVYIAAYAAYEVAYVSPRKALARRGCLFDALFITRPVQRHAVG